MNICFSDKGHRDPVDSDEPEISTPSLISSFIVDSDVSPITLPDSSHVAIQGIRHVLARDKASIK